MNEIIQGDIRQVATTLPSDSIHCIVTSPPYWGLRDYGCDGQLGLESTPEEYVSNLVAIFRELRRVLRDDGTLWLNLGDTYAANRTYQVPSSKGGPKHSPAQGFEGSGMVVPTGLKPKDLVGIPWRVAFTLQADGWWLRQDIIWAKPNPMPESVTDRCTKSHEYIFLLSKSARYYYDAEAIKEPSIYPDDDRKARSSEDQKRMPTESVAGIRPGSETYPTRNRRDVWTVTTHPYPEAHFATFPPDLIRPCILAGTSEKGCCSKCGKPWIRIINRVDQGFDGSKYGERAVGASGGAITGGTAKSTLGSSNGKLVGITQTTGWQPQCSCFALTVPCVVLDPFLGSGTAAQIAIETGRSWIGVELKTEYIELASRRTREAAGQTRLEIA